MRMIERKIGAAVSDAVWEKDGHYEILSERDRVEVSPRGVHYVLHYTNVFSLLKKTDDLPRRFQVKTGGWTTNTTKSRINALLEYFGINTLGVYQKDFIWYWGGKDIGDSPIEFSENDILIHKWGKWKLWRGTWEGMPIRPAFKGD